jgi:hypothetical protein
MLTAAFSAGPVLWDPSTLRPLGPPLDYGAHVPAALSLDGKRLVLAPGGEVHVTELSGLTISQIRKTVRPLVWTPPP